MTTAYRPSCATPDCDKPIKSKGLCATCYNRQWRAANPGTRARLRHDDKECGQPACGRPYYAADLCAGHYMQRRRGYELVPIGTMQRGNPVGYVRPFQKDRSDKGQPKPRAVSNLPAGWERTTPQPTGKGSDRTSMRLEIGRVQPLDECELVRARHTVSLMSAALGIPVRSMLEACGLVA